MSSDRPLNVLHMTTHLNLGGISSYIGTLAKALSKKGHSSSVASSGGDAVPMLTRAGVWCYDFDLATKSELHPKLWWRLPSLARFVKEEGFDLIHAHSRVTQVLAFFVSRLSRVPYVSTAHGFYTPRIGRRLFPAWGERVVAISETVEEDLIGRHGVRRERIRLIHNAVDAESFEKRLKQQDPKRLKMRYRIPEKAFVIGCLSRLVKDKGHAYLIEAVKTLAADHPDVFLLIVGDGRERTAIEEQLRAELPGRSRLVPGVLDTTGVLSLMDVFVHPATHREGFGLSIAEAMIANVPVVLTDIPALNTLFMDGRDVCMVPPKDPQALARALRRLIEDGAYAGKIAKEARRISLERCDTSRMADQMERLYKEVVGRCNGK